MNPERTCHIHAGTHKTASTYIQSRLVQNRRLLSSQGMAFEYPGRRGLKHKPLVKALNKQSFKHWNRYLKRFSRSSQDLLVSAEQFTRPLCRPGILQRLSAIHRRQGFGLHVIVFVRPQLEYMNSRYVHTLRRLYHSLSFEAYVTHHLGLTCGDIYNYRQFFAPLLDSGVRCTFLPFSRAYGDPFLQLLGALNLDRERSYAVAAPGTDNVQPGTRGVWLSRLVVEKLERLGTNGHHLKNTSQKVRRVAESQGWHEQRYFGFSAELAQQTLDHYREGNEDFAQMAWGKSWQDVFPADVSAQHIYSPADAGDDASMHRLADRIVRDLARTNPPLAQALKSAA